MRANTLLLLTSFTLGACVGPTDPAICKKTSQVDAQVLAALNDLRNPRSSSAAEESEGDEAVNTTQLPLYPLLPALWKIKKIPVCWEDSTYLLSQQDERDQVKIAVENTWNQVLAWEGIDYEDQVEFVGWTKCSEGNNTGVRMAVQEGTPHTESLGSYLAGMEAGLVHNFTFKTWSKSCAISKHERLSCIYQIAVHEFGHVLGIAHEQNRPDTPGYCNERQGTDGNLAIGEWDRDSVMNYCNPTWNNGGELSEDDIAGIRLLYYSAVGDTTCATQSEWNEAEKLAKSN